MRMSQTKGKILQLHKMQDAHNRSGQIRRHGPVGADVRQIATACALPWALGVAPACATTPLPGRAVVDHPGLIPQKPTSSRALLGRRRYQRLRWLYSGKLDAAVQHYSTATANTILNLRLPPGRQRPRSLATMTGATCILASSDAGGTPFFRVISADLQTNIITILNHRSGHDQQGSAARPSGRPAPPTTLSITPAKAVPARLTSSDSM